MSKSHPIKSKVLYLRVSEQDWRAYQAGAHRAGLTLSAYLRRQLLVADVLNRLKPPEYRGDVKPDLGYSLQQGD